MMTTLTTCPGCDNTFPILRDRCPHCERPAFPNVAMAKTDRERQALGRRYNEALRDAAQRDAEDKVRHFETETAASLAVIARSVRETERLADGDHEAYATYYGLIESGVRVAKGEKWDVLRKVADEALFGDYRDQIRFAALSLNGRALENYGEVAWVLREKLIAHRASVFEENTTLFMKRRRISMARAHKLPSGYRATWEDRSKLCVAKLAAKIESGTEPDEFPGILLRPGPTSEDDEFVEVHIGGSMTARTLERVIVMKGSRRRRKAIARALEAKLKKLGVELEA